MSIFAHLTRNIYRKFLKLGAQIRQRMEEKAKSLKKACYELDTDYPSLFSMVNGARFIKKDGVELVTLDMVKDHDGEYSDWTITIEQGQKIGEVMDRIPFGVLNKTITGLGATTLEITNQERDSIIVVPTKSLAYGKYKSANNHFGDGYAFYFGSPIKEIRSAVKPAQVKNYLDSNNQWKKKFLVVADSLPRLIEILDSYNIDVYNSYFLMVDEIDTMQADSAYRPRLEYVMDYYFKFNQKFRSAVSATLNDFSNPKMEYESKIVTRWRENPRRNIDLKYGLIVYLDGNGVPKDSMEAQGIILLAKFGNQEMISITIGDQEVHTGLIIRKKEEKVDSNTKLVVYLAIQEFNGYKVPLQIFEEYNLAKSKFIPDNFTVMICSAQTGEMIQGQSFHNVSRLR